MLCTRLWIIAASTMLVAAPAFAAQDDPATTDDCFAVAAPMADATPCFEPGHRKKQHHHPLSADSQAGQIVTGSAGASRRSAVLVTQGASRDRDLAHETGQSRDGA